MPQPRALPDHMRHVVYDASDGLDELARRPPQLLFRRHDYAEGDARRHRQPYADAEDLSVDPVHGSTSFPFGFFLIISAFEILKTEIIENAFMDSA